MKKTEVKEIQMVKDQWGSLIYPTDVALSYIANSLSNLESGDSYIRVDNNVSDSVDLTDIQNEISMGFSNIVATLEDVNSNNIQLNNNLELILMQLSRIADALENKNK